VAGGGDRGGAAPGAGMPRSHGGTGAPRTVVPGNQAAGRGAGGHRRGAVRDGDRAPFRRAALTVIGGAAGRRGGTGARVRRGGASARRGLGLPSPLLGAAFTFP